MGSFQIPLLSLSVEELSRRRVTTCNSHFPQILGAGGSLDTCEGPGGHVWPQISRERDRGSKSGWEIHQVRILNF